MSSTWDNNWIKQQEAKYGQRVEAAAIHLQNRIREVISTPSRTVRLGPPEKGKKSYLKLLGARGSNRSKPGEPPHMDHGNLRRSLAHDFTPETISSRVGSPIKYARFLELGTSKMQARPFLRRTLDEEKPAITNIITTGKS